MKDHVMVAVPAGHTVQVHPPTGAPMMGAPMAPQTGMIPDPAHAGALAAMNAAIPLPAENKTGKKTKEQPKRKKAPAESEAKEKATGAGADS